MYRQFLFILSFVTVFLPVSVIASEFEIPSSIVCYEIASGVSFGEKRMPWEQKGTAFSTKPSEPTSEVPQLTFAVRHPKHMILEQVFQRRGGRDGRRQIENTAEFFNSVFGQLQMTFHQGEATGSGTMISPHHVLTCGHNVCDPETGEWATAIEFRPGLNGNNAPFGTIPIVAVYTYAAWCNGADHDYDVAVLALARPIGEKTGWAALIAEDDRALQREKPEITGYPGDKGGVTMWTMADTTFTEMTEERFEYVIDTYGGQSGSGVWVPQSGCPYLLGVHAYGDQRKQVNSGTRISQQKFLDLWRVMSKTGELRTHRTRALVPPATPQDTQPPQQRQPQQRALRSAGPEIPPIARGHEAEYQQFLRGKLIYTDPKTKRQIELPIAALTNPLAGEFDLTRCGDTGQYLSINTGYRKRKIPANANKTEIWLAPRFLVKRELATTAAHFQPIMGNWPTTAPIGLVWTYGGWSDLSWYDYLTDIGVDDMMSKNLCDNWRCARSFTLLVYRSFDPRGRSRLMPRGILSCFIFELK